VAAARQAQAFGLAGVHIGEVAPVIVLNAAPDAATAEYRIYFNPRIDVVAPETAAGEEGSVSLPGIRLPVLRPVWADMSYDDAAGVRHRERLEGFLARCALHEIDQVEGVFFLERVSRLKREMALKKFLKGRRQTPPRSG